MYYSAKQIESKAIKEFVFTWILNYLLKRVKLLALKTFKPTVETTGEFK